MTSNLIILTDPTMAGCKDPAKRRIRLEDRRQQLLDEIRTREDQIFVIDYEIDHITGPLEEIVAIVIVQTQRMAAGCPPDCEENPWNCERDNELMPKSCLKELDEFLLREKIEMTALDELIGGIV